MRVSRLLSLGLPVLLLAGCLGVSTPSSAPVDVATPGTWTSRAPMPTPRGALAAAVLNGRIHALGGAQRDPLNAHEVYDPAPNVWKTANALPTARDHLAAVTFRGRVWALGGRSSFLGSQYANVEIYEPAADAWRTGAPLPRGRGGLAAAALPDRILVFGGEAPFRIFDATEMYEPAGDRWIAMAPMPTPRHGIGAAVVGARVYVPGGGREPGFAATAGNEAYTRGGQPGRCCSCWRRPPPWRGRGRTRWPASPTATSR